MRNIVNELKKDKTITDEKFIVLNFENWNGDVCEAFLVDNDGEIILEKFFSDEISNINKNLINFEVADEENVDHIFFSKFKVIRIQLIEEDESIKVFTGQDTIIARAKKDKEYPGVNIYLNNNELMFSIEKFNGTIRCISYEKDKDEPVLINEYK